MVTHILFDLCLFNILAQSHILVIILYFIFIKVLLIMNYEYLEIIEIQNEFFEVIISPKKANQKLTSFLPWKFIRG